MREYECSFGSGSSLSSIAIGALGYSNVDLRSSGAEHVFVRFNDHTFFVRYRCDEFYVYVEGKCRIAIAIGKYSHPEEAFDAVRNYK